MRAIDYITAMRDQADAYESIHNELIRGQYSAMPWNTHPDFINDAVENAMDARMEFLKAKLYIKSLRLHKMAGELMNSLEAPQRQALAIAQLKDSIKEAFRK